MLQPYMEEARAKAFFTSLDAFPLEIIKTANVNCTSEVEKVRLMRYLLIAGVHRLYNTGSEGEAKVLFTKFQANISSGQFPYEDANIKTYVEDYATRLE